MSSESRERHLKNLVTIDNQLIPTKIENFRSKYIIRKQIGKGAFGTVHICIEKTTRELYAVKIIDKKSFANKNSKALGLLKNEIMTIRKTNH